MGGVDAEAVDATLEPEAHHRLDGRPHLRIPPVEVRLAAGVRMQVVLTGPLVQRPGRSRRGEAAKPVVRRPTVGSRLGPHVPVAFGAVAAGPRLDEPRMLVAGVVGDEVDQDPDPTPMRLGDQPVEVGQGAVRRIDGTVVGHVVAVVDLRRRVERREPDRVDAERIGRSVIEVVEPGGDARQVADSIVVRIAEAARVDLVHHTVPPPILLRHNPASWAQAGRPTPARSQDRLPPSIHGIAVGDNPARDRC